jgi:hypothetical protein
MGKVSKNCAISAIYQKLPKMNNRPIGENSPSLVNLFARANPMGVPIKMGPFFTVTV